MYEKVKALCPDGKIRIVYHEKVDSFFSVPAYTRVRGKYVSGFVMKISRADMPPAMTDGRPGGDIEVPAAEERAEKPARAKKTEKAELPVEPVVERRSSAVLASDLRPEPAASGT